MCPPAVGTLWFGAHGLGHVSPPVSAFVARTSACARVGPLPDPHELSTQVWRIANRQPARSLAHERARVRPPSPDSSAGAMLPCRRRGANAWMDRPERVLFVGCGRKPWPLSLCAKTMAVPPDPLEAALRSKPCHLLPFPAQQVTCAYGCRCSAILDSQSGARWTLLHHTTSYPVRPAGYPHALTRTCSCRHERVLDR